MMPVGIILISLTDVERFTPNEGSTQTITWAKLWRKEKKKKVSWATADLNSLLISLTWMQAEQVSHSPTAWLLHHSGVLAGAVA